MIQGAKIIFLPERQHAEPPLSSASPP